jgi:hypothetical protein
VAVGLLAELLGAGLQLAALFASHSINASVLQERTGWPTYSTWLPGQYAAGRCGWFAVVLYRKATG